MKGYGNYQNSGIAWLGSIPDEWQLISLKFTFEVVLGKMLQPDQKSEADKKLPYLRAANIQSNGVDFSEVKKMWFTPSEVHRLRLSSGDLLISEGGDVGRPAIWQDGREMYFQNSINRVRPIGHNSTRFLYYWIVALREKGYIDVICNKSTIAHFTAEKVANLPLPLPSQIEQQKIAQFLDFEAAKIDALIDEQKRLITLLKEKRQAVISHAVTKGLNTDAPLKYSGVEWLGEIPEHWSVVYSKYLFDFVTSGSRGWADYYSDEGDLFFRIANLTRDTIEPKLESIQRVTPPQGSEGERSRIKINDILFSITADLGSVCVADDSAAGGYVSQHVALARPSPKVINARWLAYSLISDPSKAQILGSSYGGTKIQLSLSDVKEIVLVEPSKAEQLKIADYLDDSLLKMNRLLEQAESLISLLTERRSALISAAVTGKIDVRDWQPPQGSDRVEKKESAQTEMQHG